MLVPKNNDIPKGSWQLQELHLFHIASSLGLLEGRFPAEEVQRLQQSLIKKLGFKNPIVKLTTDGIAVTDPKMIAVARIMYYPKDHDESIRLYSLCYLVDTIEDAQTFGQALAIENWSKCELIESDMI